MEDPHEFDLNISWLTDLQQQGDNKGDNNNIHQEKEAMDTIRISFLYVNVHREIHKILSEIHDLEIEDDDGLSSSVPYLSSSVPYLSKDYVHSVVSQKIQLEKSHYKWMDGFLFHIGLDFSEIGLESSFRSNSFVFPVSIVDDIPVPFSLPVFHSANCLFFIFHEIPVCKKPSLHICGSVDIQPDLLVKQKHSTHKRRSLVKYTRKQKIVV